MSMEINHFCLLQFNVLEVDKSGNWEIREGNVRCYQPTSSAAKSNSIMERKIALCDKNPLNISDSSERHINGSIKHKGLLLLTLSCLTPGMKSFEWMIL